MKRFVFIALIMLSMVMLHSETLIFECDYWAPYNAMPNSEEPGFQVEVTQRIFENAGFKFEYRLVPFSRALQNVQSGAAHGTFGLYESEANSNNLLLPKNHLGIGQTYFYVLASSDWKYDGVASLEGKMLGTIQDYEYDEGELDEYIEKHKNTMRVQVMTGDNALENNIRKLLNDRINVTIEDETVMEWKLIKMGLEGKVRKAGIFDDSYKIFVAFSPTRPDLVKVFDEGFEKLRKSGELKKILDKYNVSF